MNLHKATTFSSFETILILNLLKVDNLSEQSSRKLAPDDFHYLRTIKFQ